MNLNQESSMYQFAKLKPVERLFLRLASIYGKHWIDMWSDVPIEAVHAEWQNKLTGLSAKTVFGAADYCADNLKFPPTLPEFMQICKAKTPQEITKALERKFTEDEIESNKKRIEKIAKDLAASKVDHKAWARKIRANPSDYPEDSLKKANQALAMVD